MKNENKQTVLIAGATGSIGKAAAVALAERGARHPAVAGEPIAELILSDRDRNSINGAQFKLYKRIKKPDKAMTDELSGWNLWEELVVKTSTQYSNARS